MELFLLWALIALYSCFVGIKIGKMVTNNSLDWPLIAIICIMSIAPIVQVMFAIFVTVSWVWLRFGKKFFGESNFLDLINNSKYL